VPVLKRGGRLRSDFADTISAIARAARPATQSYDFASPTLTQNINAELRQQATSAGFLPAENPWFADESVMDVM
jgi:hypothetical protein